VERTKFKVHLHGMYTNIMLHGNYVKHYLLPQINLI
jgi:hypothetical protein